MCVKCNNILTIFCPFFVFRVCGNDDGKQGGMTGYDHSSVVVVHRHARPVSDAITVYRTLSMECIQHILGAPSLQNMGRITALYATCHCK